MLNIHSIYNSFYKYKYLFLNYLADLKILIVSQGGIRKSHLTPSLPFELLLNEHPKGQMSGSDSYRNAFNPT